ncbi:hypothetical protein TNCV_4724531 [Trichonephila clavipes]|uniref:Uncharacterized protein n=1 Tax=Trichonephila clavipes TaxID=2585209 RepID=A0A8X7BFC9_TRICX|nr:hypothetical protein TNCV_4724531 [Trichonephila clavipes]
MQPDQICRNLLPPDYAIHKPSSKEGKSTKIFTWLQILDFGDINQANMKEYEEISALLDNGVSDFGSLPRCTTIGCPLPTSHANSPINSSEFPALPTLQQTTTQQNAQAGVKISSSTAANMNTTQTGVTPSSQKPGLTNTSTQGVQPRVTPSSTQNNTPKVPPGHVFHH